MNSDVIDSSGPPLAERMQELMSGATSARLAVGYLFLEGLTPLCRQIGEVGSLEILVGNVVNRLTEEQVQEEAAARLRGGEGWAREQEDVAATLKASRDRAAAETALNLRRTLDTLPRTPEVRLLIFTIARRIAEGALKTRLYTAGRIHSKLALVGYHFGSADALQTQAPLAVVGSSNLTMNAPSHSTELNIIVRDPKSVAALDLWYQGLWNSAQDFTRELFDELGQSWALTSALSEER